MDFPHSCTQGSTDGWLFQKTQIEARPLHPLTFLEAEENVGFPYKTVLNLKKHPNHQTLMRGKQSHIENRLRNTQPGHLSGHKMVCWHYVWAHKVRAIQAERPTGKAKGFHLGKHTFQRSVEWNSLEAFPNSEIRQICKSPYVT